MLAHDVERRAGQQGLAGRRQASQPPALVDRVAGLEDVGLVDSAELDDLTDVDADPQPGNRSLPTVLTNRLVQRERRIDRGIRRLEVDLVGTRRLRSERAAPAGERLLEQFVERSDDLADPAQLVAMLPSGIRIDQLAKKQHDQPAGDALRQRSRVEPHYPHLVGQVPERAELHADAVVGDDPLQVLELKPAQLVGFFGGRVEAQSSVATKTNTGLPSSTAISYSNWV